MDFTLKTYRHSLVKAKNAGARFLRPDELFPLSGRESFSGLTIILRHDVDHRLDRALKMARLENSLGIRSAYYLRLGPEHGFPTRLAMRFGSSYNVFCDSDFHMVREILSLGHEIGLHYEWVQWERYGIEPCRLIALQADLIRTLFGLSSIGGAAHGSKFARENGRPNTAIFRELGVTAEACGLRYFFYQELDKLNSCDYTYYSDAGGHWNYGNAIHDQEFLMCPPPLKVVLVHPDWWAGYLCNLEVMGRRLLRGR